MPLTDAPSPIAQMTVVPREPIVGPSLAELRGAGRARETIRLAEQVATPRCALAFRTPGPYPVSLYGFAFDDPAFKVYKGQEFIVCRLERVTVPGNSGVILHDGVVLSDTLMHLMPGWPGSNVESCVHRRSVRFLSDLPVTRRVSEGRFFVGFTASWRNYAHWLQECVPNLVAFIETRRRDPELKLVVPRFASGSFQQQTLALLGVTGEMLFELDPDETVTFDDAWVPTHSDLWGALPYVAASCARLAEGVFQQFAADELGGEARGERIYLSRRNATRTVENFADVRSLVERHGFEVVEPDQYPLAQQIAIMRRARHVIAEHGAGMGNILFCQRGASVLELFNPICVQPAFWSVATACGLRFGFLVGDHPPNAETAQSEWHSNYTVPLATLEEAISAMFPDCPGGVARIEDSSTPVAGDATVQACGPLLTDAAAPDDGSALFLQKEPGERETPGQDAFSAKGSMPAWNKLDFDIEPPVGQSLAGLIANGRLSVAAEVSAAAEMRRRPFFLAMPQRTGEAQFGAHLTSPSFAAYDAARWFVAAGDQAVVLGSDGIVAFDGRLLADTLSAISYWESTSLTESFTAHTALRLRRPISVTRRIGARPCLVGFHPAWRNYAHWLQQSLPILAAYRWLKKASPDLAILLPRFDADSFQHQTIDALGIGADEIEIIDHHEAVVLDRVLIASPIDLWAVPPSVPVAAKILAMNFPLAKATFGERIFIHRRSPLRRLVNFANLAPLLAAYGFTVVTFEDTPVAEQASIMRAARFVIGEHGAGLINILFCRPGARVIELFNPGCVQPEFWSVSSAVGLDHGYLVGERATPDAPIEWNAPYTIEPRLLADAIRLMLGDFPLGSPTPSEWADLASVYERCKIPLPELAPDHVLSLAPTMERRAANSHLLFLDTVHGTRLYWDAFAATIRHGPSSLVPANLLLRVTAGRGQFFQIGAVGTLLNPLSFDPKTRRGRSGPTIDDALSVDAEAGKLSLRLDGRYLCADLQGFITADRDLRFDWESFTPVDVPDLVLCEQPSPRSAE